MKAPTLILCIVAIILFAGCARPKPDPNLKIRICKRANPWTHLNLYNDPNNFQFAIVADRTGNHRPGVFAQAVDKLNLLHPEFVISIGDLIEGKAEDQNELNRQWNEFDSLVDRLNMPFFYLPGNHDIGNQVMAQVWQQRLGPSYYHFTYRNVLFLCLNTEDPPPSSISNQQMAYFEDVLESNRHVRWTLLFMHKPLWWKRETVDYWYKFVALLAQRPYTVFAGHRHIYSKEVFKDRSYYVLAATGAGEPEGLEQCEFDHVIWVTMTDNGPVLANLLLEGILNDSPCPQ